MPIYQGKALETHYNGFINKQKPKFIFFVINYFFQQLQKYYYVSEETRWFTWRKTTGV